MRTTALYAALLCTSACVILSADTDSGDTDADSDSATDSDSGSGTEAPLESRCDIDGDTIICDHRTLALSTGLTGLQQRQVHFQVPTGVAPAEGWPVVLLFQGSGSSGEHVWTATRDASWGGWHQSMTAKSLLDAGYALLTPEAHLNGATFWDTNQPAWAYAWKASPDHQFMLDIFASLDDGDFGDIDVQRMHATGISSGGYMTSRMALSYPGQFRSLAIQSASWARCGGAICTVPNNLPSDHPPTLFLHGDNDNIVPIRTVRPYHEGLADQGTATALIVDNDVGHAWIPAAPDAIVRWFDDHP